MIRIGLMLFALLAAAAVSFDLVSLRLRAQKAMQDGGSTMVAEALIDVTTATNRYHHERRRFSIACPPGWEAIRGSGGQEYDVTLRGPHQLELAVMRREAERGGPAALRERLRKTEERLRLKTSLQDILFQGQPAFQRVVPLNKIKIESVDFLAGRDHLHIMVSAPREAFDDLRPVLVALRDTFELDAEEE